MSDLRKQCEEMVNIIEANSVARPCQSADDLEVFVEAFIRQTIEACAKIAESDGHSMPHVRARIAAKIREHGKVTA